VTGRSRYRQEREDAASDRKADAARQASAAAETARQARDAESRARASDESRALENAEIARRAAADAALAKLDTAATRAAQEAAKAADAESARKTAEDVRLRRFGQKQFGTEIREMGVFAWKDTKLKDKMSVSELIAAIRKRLDYLRVGPAEALVQCTGHPSVEDVEHETCVKAFYFSLSTSLAFALHLVPVPRLTYMAVWGWAGLSRYGVDSNTVCAFTKQLYYEISDERASQLLHNAREGAGLAPDGGAAPVDANVLPVRDFLRLFGWTPGGHERPVEAVQVRLKANKVDQLTPREREIVGDLRESLIERFSTMKKRFEMVDKVRPLSTYDFSSGLPCPVTREQHGQAGGHPCANADVVMLCVRMCLIRTRLVLSQSKSSSRQ
jgi:hypothetical protein